MIDALKKMDKKFLVFISGLIFIPILIIIILFIIQGCSNRKISYKKYESKMIKAAEKYIKHENKMPKIESDYVIVNLDKLIKNGYIKDSNDLLDDKECSGNVTVRRNGSSIEINDGGYLNYTVNLKCKSYSTIHLNDKLKEDLVTSESGLYSLDDGYIFKGNKVKNYINFYGQIYRIMSIDGNGIIKLIKNESENGSKIWDNKFNTEVNKSYGKTIYKDSVILDYLMDDYKNTKKFKKDARSHIVAYDACIGKRSNADYSINKSLDCSEILEDQVISMVSISDYAMASLDQECNNLRSRSCNNYNYLHNMLSSTWTTNASSNDSYEVLYVSDGLMESKNANSYNEYNIVIYIDGNELYNDGDGTESNPYTLNFD